jgi:hypothetical protein
MYKVTYTSRNNLRQYTTYTQTYEVYVHELPIDVYELFGYTIFPIHYRAISCGRRELEQLGIWPGDINGMWAISVTPDND